MDPRKNLEKEANKDKDTYVLLLGNTENNISYLWVIWVEVFGVILKIFTSFGVAVKNCEQLEYIFHNIDQVTNRDQCT